MNPSVAEAIKKSAAVPSVPQVVTRFLEVIQDPDFDYDCVVKALSVDAGTVSEILRLANSALFGVSRKVTSLRQALALLGPRRTRSLVLGRFLVETVGDNVGRDLDSSYFWRRSLASAVVAARLAEVLSPRLREEVFLSGLLADVGVSILAQTFPQQYAPLAAKYGPYGSFITDEEEQETVETTHAEVSAMILSHWSLPEAICQAVALSHAPAVEVKDEGTQMARIINASDRIAKLLCEIPDVRECVEVCAEAMDFVGVELDVLVKLLSDVEKDVQELATILQIDVIPSSVYTKIAEAIQERLATASG